MIIGIDIDGVLADYVGHINEFYNKLMGTNFKKEDYHTMKFWDTWSITKKEAEDVVRQMFDAGWYPNMPVINGSQKVTRKLSEKQDLALVTSRQSYTTQQTLIWLSKYFSNIFSSSHFTDFERLASKYQVYSSLKCKLVLEDDLDHALSIAQESIEVLLFNQPWNQKPYELNGLINKITNWQEAELFLKQRGIIDDS